MMMQQQDISTMTIQELESLGYRVVKDLELAKRNLATIEATIEQKKKEELDGRE